MVIYMKKAVKDILIIIPAYNEEKTIGRLLEQLENPEISEIADILVMNDSSKDDTERLVRERGHAVVTHIYHMGYGSGLQIGYKYAVKKGYKYLIQMDADGQHDICNIKKLYERIICADNNGRTPDIVLGSRYMEGSSEYHAGVMKKIAYVFFRGLIKLFTGKRISDPISGLQILNSRAFTFYSKYANFDDKYPDANMILQMLLLGFKVEEIPAVMHYRTEGKSMHSGVIKPIIYMFRMMYSIIAVWMTVKVYHSSQGDVLPDETVSKNI
ncbi:MAG: glycosyltransferase family 2 protein [Lachnospiraceae bacterium]|nr:glycosyltransferase family 2 protein [Lachnospiraceae bacterium]